MHNYLLIGQFDPLFELPQELLGRSFVEAPFTLLEEQMEVVFGKNIISKCNEIMYDCIEFGDYLGNVG